MRQTADLTLADVVRGLARYRPVAVTVGVVVLAGVLLGPIAGGDAGEDVSGDLLGNPAPRSSGTEADDLAGADTGDGADDESAAAPIPPPAQLGRSASPDPFFSPRPTGSGSASSSPPPAGFDSSPEPGSSFSPSPPFDGGGGGIDGAEEELVVTATLWTSREAGTPLAASGVPEGTLPVGKRLDQTDKATYLRFDGSGTLTLTEDPEGTRAPRPGGEVALDACQVTEPGWEEGEAASFDDAPPHDEADCTPGARAEDGTWTFELSGFDGTAGVALVPGPEAPLDFQVAFASPTG